MSTSRSAVISVIAMMLAAVFLPLAYGQVTTGPSNFCHVSDGAFTACPDGNQEWSDVVGASFFDADGSVLSVLYVDQADLDSTRAVSASVPQDTLMLMYDEVARTVPLLSGESVHVHFMTVDELQLLHYDVFIGAGGLQKVLINGVEQVPMPAGVAGTVGFGPSPNNSTSHVVAEFQIGLEAAGFSSEECCYSPDPAWWGSDVPPNPGEPVPGEEPCPRDTTVVDTTQLGDGQFLCPQEPQSTTAAVVTAGLDGKTTVDPEPLLPPGTEPPLCETIGSIVDFRVPPTATYRNHGDYVKQVAQLTEALLASQVAAGIISLEEAEEIQSCVVNPRARSDVGK